MSPFAIHMPEASDDEGDDGHSSDSDSLGEHDEHDEGEEDDESQEVYPNVAAKKALRAWKKLHREQEEDVVVVDDVAMPDAADDPVAPAIDDIADLSWDGGPPWNIRSRATGAVVGTFLVGDLRTIHDYRCWVSCDVHHGQLQLY
jgi:hypothetical protein